MTCSNQVYHEECFKTDVRIPERDEVIEDSRIIPIKHQDDFDLGVVDREKAEEILSEKKHGTFLLRFSFKKRKHVISRKKEEDIEHLTVEQVQVGEVMFYSLKPGQGRRSLLLVVENHRLDCQLFIPINSGDRSVPRSRESSVGELEEQIPEVKEDDYIEYDSDEYEEQQATAPDNNHGLRVTVTVTTEESFEEYNHGDISRFEAEDLLSNEVEGTFLLRECEGGLRLSRVPHRFGNLARHFIVHRDRINFYYLTSRQKFRTVEELVAFYQNVENSDKYWLGVPLYTNKALDKVGSGIFTAQL